MSLILNCEYHQLPVNYLDFYYLKYKKKKVTLVLLNNSSTTCFDFDFYLYLMVFN